MGINIYEIIALFSLLAVGYAAGWCFKGLWDKALDDRFIEKFVEVQHQEEQQEESE